MRFFNSNLKGKFWNKSTLIWVGFLGVRFYPFFPTRLLVWNKYLASCINDFFDRYNLSRRKKLHLKVFLNRFMLTPVKIYLFKFYSRNTRRRCETSSELAIKTPEWRHRRCSGVFIVNFECIWLLFLLFLFLTLNK